MPSFFCSPSRETPLVSGSTRQTNTAWATMQTAKKTKLAPAPISPHHRPRAGPSGLQWPMPIELVGFVGDPVHGPDDFLRFRILREEGRVLDHLDHLVVVVLEQTRGVRLAEKFAQRRDIFRIKDAVVVRRSIMLM